jgi:SAM-dependent methyltransferase
MMQPDWDQRYRQGNTPWDKGRASPALIYWLKNYPGRISGHILIPGCGTGHDVRAIADAEPTSSPLGIDISSTAIATCLQNKVHGNEQYEQTDLFQLSRKFHAAFDWVWEHTCYCAIDPSKRPKYISAIASALKPNGIFLGIFYLNPEIDATIPNDGPPHGTSIQEVKSLFLADIQFVLLDSKKPDACYPGRDGREHILQFQRV